MHQGQELHRPPVPRRAGTASTSSRGIGVLAAAAVACGLIACGDDEDSSATLTAEPPPVKTADLAVRVIDGPLEKALVCLDANANLNCDEGEVKALTDAEGMAKLTLPEAEMGKHGVLAMVPVGAVDKDHGEVKTAYLMRSPADAPTLVSPLTTLVQSQLDRDGGGKATEAVAALQEQLGFKLGLLDDYSKLTDAPAKLAADMARLCVLLQQQQVQASQGAKDAAGNAVPQRSLAALIARSALGQLDEIAAAAVVVNLMEQDPAAKASALQERAIELDKAADLRADRVAALAAIAELPVAPGSAASAASASLSLRWLSFQDKGNYDYRSFHATAAQNTPDAQGKRHYTEFKEYRSSGIDGSTDLGQFGVSHDGRGDKSWKATDSYWTGTEWFSCPAEYVHEASVWDKDGKSESLYCKSYRSSYQRRVRDISGLTLAAVVKEIRAYPFSDGLPYSAWGPDPQQHADALAVNFPPNSKLYYQSSRYAAGPVGYGSNAVKVYVQALAQASKPQCEAWSASTDSQMKSNARSLDQLIEANQGMACAYATDAQTGARNEAWAASTLRLGRIYDAGLGAPSSHYLGGTRDLRFSFGADKSVKYWSCLMRVRDQSPRNCDAIGVGAYTIEALGDARVLRLSGLPSQATMLGRQTLLVERGDKVYSGFQDRPKQVNQIRLNKEAVQALFTALQVPY